MSERNFREKSKNCKILSMVLQNHTKLWNAIRNGIVMIKMANDEQEQLAEKKGIYQYYYTEKSQHGKSKSECSK